MNIANEFIKIAQKYPSKISIVSESEEPISYRELNDYSNFIANELLNISFNSKTIGVLLPRSSHLIAAIIGILKIGKAYLPIDPQYPQERIEYIMKNSNIEYVICDENTKKIVKDDYQTLVLSNEKHQHKNDIIKNDNKIACVLYTSGSTGLPNGVMLSHSSILNTVRWAINYYKLNDNDVSLQIPSISFVSSVQDIFSTLLSAGKLVIINEQRMLNARYLNMLVEKYDVTHFDMVPSLYREYLRVLKSTNKLRFVMLEGEPISLRIKNDHFDKMKGVQLFNEYGMSETSSCAFVKELLKEDSVIRIGKPISNMAYIIHNPDGEGVGELYISGKGLASGYYNNNILNCEKYITINNIKYLKSGDFVKQDTNGDLIYLYRKDAQIKINGKRVNLLEIDYILQSDKETIDSITLPFWFKNRQMIVSFVIGKNKKIEYYYSILRSKLPEGLQPNYIKMCDDFIYLPNKKINKRLMIDMFKDELNITLMKADKDYEKLLNILYDVSGGTVIDPNVKEELKNLGIDSICFIRTLAEIEEKFNFEFGYDDIQNMGKVTIESLYNYIKDNKNE